MRHLTNYYFRGENELILKRIKLQFIPTTIIGRFISSLHCNRFTEILSVTNLAGESFEEKHLRPSGVTALTGR